MKLDTSFLLASLAASAAAAPALNPNAAKRWANSPDGQELHADVVAAVRRLAQNPSLREGGIAARETDVVQIVTARQAPVTQINQGGQNPAPVSQVVGGGNGGNPGPSQAGQGGNGGNPGPSQAGQGGNDQDAQPTQVLQARQRGRGGRGGRNGAATQAGQGGNAQNSQPTQNPAPVAPVAGQNPVPTQAVQNPAPVAPGPQPTQVAQGGNVQNPAAGTQAGQTGAGPDAAPVTQGGQAGNGQNAAPVTQVGQAGNGQNAQPTQIVKARQVPGDSIRVDLHGRQPQPTQAAVLPGDFIVVRQNAPVVEIDQAEIAARQNSGGSIIEFITARQNSGGSIIEFITARQNSGGSIVEFVTARQNPGGSIVEFVTARQNAPETQIVRGIPQPTQIVQVDNRIIQQGRRYAAPQASEVPDFRPQATQVVQARQNGQNQINEDSAGAPEDNTPNDPLPELPPNEEGNRNSAGEEVVRRGRRYAAPQASEVFNFRPQSTQVVQARQNGQNQNNGDFAGAPEDNTPNDPLPELPPNEEGNGNSQGEDFAGPGKRYASPQDLPPLSSFGDDRLVTRQQGQASQNVGPSEGGLQPPALDPIPTGPVPPIDENSAGVVVISARQQGRAGEEENANNGPSLPPARDPISTGPGAPIDNDSNGEGVVITARQQGGAGEGDSNGAPLLPPARNPISTGPGAPIDNDSSGEGVVITARQDEPAAAPVAGPPPTRPLNSRQAVALPDDPSAPDLAPPRDAPGDIAPPAPSNPEGDPVVVIGARQADARLTRPNEQADGQAPAGNAPSEPGNRVVVNARQGGRVEPDTDADAQNPNPRVPSEPIARDNGNGVLIDARQTDLVEPDLEPTTPGGPSGPNDDDTVIIVARQIVALPDDPNAPEDPVPVDVLTLEARQRGTLANETDII